MRLGVYDHGVLATIEAYLLHSEMGRRGEIAEVSGKGEAMSIKTARDGQETGDWMLQDLQAAVTRGDVLPSDLVWVPGWAEWKTLFLSADELGIRINPSISAEQPGLHPPESATPVYDGRQRALAIWNPNAAVNWSVLFSPVFGALLQAKNWNSLGESGKSTSAMRWFYAGLAIHVVLLFASVPLSISAPVSFWFLIIWYFAAGRAQVHFVKEKLSGNYQKKSFALPLLAGIGYMFVLGLMLTTFQDGALDSKEVRMVKGGVLESCPSHTVGQMADGFMGSPSWNSGSSNEGVKFVNVSGDIVFHDKPVRATVQFVIDGDRFSFNAFEMNDVPSANIVAIGLLKKMCDSADSKPAT